ncbi:MAG: 2-amino-4-hydroxy-6-hydroxymethyldihydropteridine diphosphokinase [Thermomicrobiales bacterium]
MSEGGVAAYIGLGSNLHDRFAILNHAVEHLNTLGSVTANSSIYETDPVGFVDQPQFLNAVVRLHTNLQPAYLLANLIRIEVELGRVRTFPNAPRTIDLDLLLVGDMVINTAELTVPHPKLHERSFVLLPLAEIAPEVLHPVLDVSIGDLLKRLVPVSGLRPIATFLNSDSAHGQ